MVAADSPMVRRFMGLYERAGASPAAARMVSEIVRTCDVTPVLPALHVPTLVVHRREDPFALAPWGLAMAEAIPEARYVEIEGDDHLPWMGDPSELVAAVEDHLAVDDRRHSSSRLLGTVLFTDLTKWITLHKTYSSKNKNQQITPHHVLDQLMHIHLEPGPCQLFSNSIRRGSLQ